MTTTNLVLRCAVTSLFLLLLHQKFSYFPIFRRKRNADGQFLSRISCIRRKVAFLPDLMQGLRSRTIQFKLYYKYVKVRFNQYITPAFGTMHFGINIHSNQFEGKKGNNGKYRLRIGFPVIIGDGRNQGALPVLQILLC